MALQTSFTELKLSAVSLVTEIHAGHCILQHDDAFSIYQWNYQLAEILFIFVYLLIFLTLIGYEFFFALSRFLFTERLHYTRMVLAFILKGFFQRNGHMVEKHLAGWLVRTTINLFLLSLKAELKQILQLKNSCIFAKLSHFWPLTLIAFSNYGTSLVNLYLKSPSAVSTSSKTFCNKL